MKRRADQLLVERGIFESRARAQAAIAAGLVTVSGVAVRKASEMLAADAAIEATPEHPYVSRGALKLEAALDAFSIDPAGLACLDVGASTGGFTELLLSRGAWSVVAVDVGRGQLHERLRRDPRVTSLEGQDVRTLAPLPEAPHLAAVDVSFISLRLVLPAVARLLGRPATLVALIKPQFEVGRQALGKGGIVRDARAQDDACAAIVAVLTAEGFAVEGPIPSPIEGGDGNREFLVCGRCA